MSNRSTGSHKTLKRLVWLYFWLLIFEGALRKWVFPQFANPLLIVRDPVVIAIYLMAVRDGVWPRSNFVICIIGLGVVTFLGALLASQFYPLVALFGLRSNFLHLPLIFLLPQIFDHGDVLRV